MESSIFSFSRKIAQMFFLFALFFRIETRFLELVIGDRGFHAVGDELHALLYFGNLIRKHCLAQFHAGARFVEKINRLVRQETIWNIAIRKIDGIADRFFGVTYRVKFFVAVAYALEHANRFLFAGCRNFYSLEASFKRTILLHRLAILRQELSRRCTEFRRGSEPVSKCWLRRASLPLNLRPQACATRR